MEKKNCYVCEYAQLATEATHEGVECINYENDQKLIYVNLCDDCYADNEAEMALAHTNRYYDWTSDTTRMLDTINGDMTILEAKKIVEKYVKHMVSTYTSSYQDIEEIARENGRKMIEAIQYTTGFAK